MAKKYRVRDDHPAQAWTDVLWGKNTSNAKGGQFITNLRSAINSQRTEYPRISIQVVEAFSGHVLEWLADGRIDVAVLYNAPGRGIFLPINCLWKNSCWFRLRQAQIARKMKSLCPP